jgi:DNA-binding transcriptional ArsR family regulator
MSRWSRPILLLAAVAAGVALLRWAGYLGRSLPDRHVADQWRLARVGLDVALAGCLVALAWLGRRRRRDLVRLAAATAALLVCDAWFDVVLDWDGPDRWTSVLVAVLVELPGAVALVRFDCPVPTRGGPVREVLPVEVDQVHADPRCRAVVEALGREGPADEWMIAASAGLHTAAVGRALERMRAAGAVRRRRDGRWARVPQDLRRPEPDAVAWGSGADRARYQRFVAALYHREVRILEHAARQRDTFGAWAAGSRSAAHLTAPELAAFEREYLELVYRYGQLRSRPTAGTREVALRFHGFPISVVREVDRELERERALEQAGSAEPPSPAPHRARDGVSSTR